MAANMKTAPDTKIMEGLDLNEGQFIAGRFVVFSILVLVFAGAVLVNVLKSSYPKNLASVFKVTSLGVDSYLMRPQTLLRVLLLMVVFVSSNMSSVNLSKS